MNWAQTTTSLRIAALLCLATGDARAAGFFLHEQSVAASGRAFAGDAAAAEDTGTVFSNPAGMTQLHGGLQGSISAYLIAPESNVSDRGSTLAVGPFPSRPVGGRNADQGFNPQPTAGLSLAAPLNQDLWVGLAVTVPFGLKDHYQLDYFGRYDSTKTELRTVDVAPSAAYAITPWLSVGGGIDIQRADAKLENALPNPLAPGGPSPASDGLFDATGGDWAVGFNIGVLVKPVEKLRVGFSYRSAIDHNLKGDSKTQIATLGILTAQPAAARFTLPDIAALGAAYELTPSLTVLGQIERHGWSRFQNIRLTFADGTQQIIPQNYRDSLGGSIGAEWRFASAWTLRGGTQFDETPTPDGNRSTAVPDSDRTWLALGLSYEVTSKLGIDFSFMHDLSNTAQIDRNVVIPALLTSVSTKGNITDTSNVVGFALRFRS